MKKCLAIVLSNEYMVGAIALIKSIKYHTPNFTEEIIVLEENLTNKHKKMLLSLHANIKFFQVSPDLDIKPRVPFKKNQNWFSYKLRLAKFATCYDRIMYLDVDMLFLTSVQPLLDIEPKYNTFLIIERRFNTGLLILGKQPDTLYSDLVEISNKYVHLGGDEKVYKRAISNGLIQRINLHDRWARPIKTLQKHHVTVRKDHVFGIHFITQKPWRAKGLRHKFHFAERIWKRYYKLNLNG